jgi:hypothetical protein
MVGEIRSDHESELAAMTHVAHLLGVGTPETVRKWWLGVLPLEPPQLRRLITRRPRSPPGVDLGLATGSGVDKNFRRHCH